ncbi:MAG: inositol monophosphatase family protein [Acidimicrobiia bacterium]
MSASGNHPALEAAATAARSAYATARASFDRATLEEKVKVGADGTPTMHIDLLIEDAIAEAIAPYKVNLLSEESGFTDVGSAVTLVIDPLDGSANAAAGVPIAGFGGAVAIDGVFTEALTVWLETGMRWSVRASDARQNTTTGRTSLDGAAVSLLRPHPHHPTAAAAWWRIAERAARIRILSCSTIEAVLVADGATDAFADAGTDTHRLVDLAPALVHLPVVGGCVIDAFGRPIEFDTDLTRRWSGVVAASQELAEQLAESISG